MPLKSKPEEMFWLQIRGMKLPMPEREYRFHPTRLWRFDFAWPALKLAVEIEGGTFGTSRHTTGSGYAADCTKYNEAVLLGWRVIRATSAQVKSGVAIEWLERALMMTKEIR